MFLENFKFKRIVLFLFSLSFLFLSHCLTPPNESILLFPSVGEKTSLPDSDYFYFDLDEGHYDRLGVETPLYEISTTEAYGDAQDRDSVSNCEIEHINGDDAEDFSSETKICILDIMEHDLVVNDLRIIYNIPEGMCRYVKISPPWHYNDKTGKGPETIFECSRRTKEDEDESTELPLLYCAEPTNGLENVRGRPVPETTSPTSLYTCPSAVYTSNARCTEEVENLCAYSRPDPEGEEDIRCCSGTYENSSDGSDGEWDPDGLTKCLGGPGRTSWEHFDSDGFPATLIRSISEYGVRGAFEIKNLLEVTGGRPYSSTPMANYLEVLDQEPEDLRDMLRTKLPEFLQKPPSLPAPNLFFDVECLDSAGEVLHKLQMMVREWNTHEEFLEFYDEGGDEDPDPDVVGYEGEDGKDGCDYEERGTLKSEKQLCNDAADFYDFKQNFPGVPYSEFSYSGSSSSE